MADGKEADTPPQNDISQDQKVDSISQNIDAVRIVNLERNNELHKEVIRNYEQTFGWTKCCLGIIVGLFAIVVALTVGASVYIAIDKTTEFNRLIEDANSAVSNIKTISKEAEVHFIRAYYWHMAAIAIEQNDREAADKYYEKINKLSKRGKYDEAAEEIGEVSEIDLQSIGLQSFDPWIILPASYTTNIFRGVNRFEMAKIEQDEQKQKQLRESAKRFVLTGRKMGEGSGAYELARMFASESNEEECEKWLKICKEEGGLPIRKNVEVNPDFTSVIGKKWFKDIWGEDTEK